jgi:YbaB/EbfC DNA-binding family
MSSKLVGLAEGEAVSQDPEDFLADWERRAEQRAMLTTELSRRMQENSASAESRAGEAVVTVDHSGGLTDLTLSERAMQLSARELADVILKTSRRAQAKMAQQIGDMVKGLYGSDSEAAAFITGAYAEQFPEPAEDEKGDRR